MALETNPVKVTRNYRFTTSLSTPLPLSNSSLLAESGNQTTAGKTDPSKLVFTIKGLPKDGQIKKNSTVLATNGTFTQADINSGIIVYQHDPAKLNVLDSFPVCVKEVNASGTTISRQDTCFTIEINITIPEVPPTGQFNGITLLENTEKVLARANFDYDDGNNPGVYSQVFFEIQSPPSKGKLMLNGVPLINSGDKFTQEDINGGKVKYVNQNASIDPNAETDQFTFKSTDPQKKYGPLETFPITIQQLIEAPTVQTTELVVNQGSTKKVNEAPAKNIDAQDKDTTADKLTFTVTTVPTQGDMQLNGTALKAGDKFTQADVDAGKLAYKHNNGETDKDSFAFSVTDGTTTVTGTLSIKITIPTNLPPNVEIHDINVAQGATTNVTTSNIKVTDPESLPNDKIKMKIVNLPRYGTLKLNGTPMTVGQEFTYADVVAGTRWTFTHDGSSNLQDVLKVSVSDGKNVAEYPINIVVAATVNKPPQVDLNSPSNIDSGATATIDNKVLKFSDPDSPPTAVKLKLTSVPAHGTLKAGGQVVAVGQEAVLTAWAAGLGLTYENNASDTATTDTFQFKLFDEVNTVGPFTYTINIKQKPPSKTPGLKNNGMHVVYKDTKAIKEDALTATDDDTVDSKLVFTLKTVPSNGSLLLAGRALLVGDTFTVADIKGLKLSYKNSNQVPTDTFDFTLADDATPTPNKIDGTFTITIDPGLKLTTGETNVGNGNSVVLKAPALDASTPRKSASQTSEVVFTVTTAPLYGTVQLGGADVTTFTLKDLNDGKVTYKHAGTSAEPIDTFGVSVTDGVETLDGTVKVNVASPADPDPVLINLGMTVQAASCKYVTPTMLFATDKSAIGADITPDQLIFTLTSTVTNVHLKKNNAELSSGGTFTAKDIKDGLIQVCVDDTQQTSASLPMTLSETGKTFNTFNYNVTIQPSPPTTLVSGGLATSICSDQGLTPYVLRVDNPPTGVPESQVVFTLTTPPQRGTLKKAGVELKAGDTFTQADISAGIIVYSNRTTNAGVDGFAFSWAAGDKTGAGQFGIDIQYANNPPWMGVINGITVFEKSTTPIDRTNLMIYDVDLDAIGPVQIPPDLTTQTVADRGIDRGGFSQVFSVNLGDKYSYTLTINKGSARFVVVRTDTNAVIADSTCTKVTKTGNFTIPAGIEDAKVIVSTGCNLTARDTSYSLTITKQ